VTVVSDQRAGEDVESPPVAEFIDVSKRFGQVVACDHVNLVLRRGRIHGILGENGAGKSTLMKMLIGLVLPDSGTIKLHGQAARITDPIDAAPALQPGRGVDRVGERRPR
jgi:simple sugar transport system ATP-binding protein